MTALAATPFLIYALCEPGTAVVRYVGKSTTGLRRPKLHTLPSSLKPHTHKNRWVRSLLARGERPNVVVLEVAPTEASLSNLERRWIAQGRAVGWQLTNATDGGDGWSGMRHTPETRLKQSLAATGRSKHPDAVARSAASKRGSKHSAETKELIGARQRGRPKTQAHRDRIRAGALRRWARERGEL